MRHPPPSVGAEPEWLPSLLAATTRRRACLWKGRARFTGVVNVVRGCRGCGVARSSAALQGVCVALDWAFVALQELAFTPDITYDVYQDTAASARLLMLARQTPPAAARPPGALLIDSTSAQAQWALPVRGAGFDQVAALMVRARDMASALALLEGLQALNLFVIAGASTLTIIMIIIIIIISIIIHLNSKKDRE